MVYSFIIIKHGHGLFWVELSAKKCIFHKSLIFIKSHPAAFAAFSSTFESPTNNDDFKLIFLWYDNSKNIPGLGLRQKQSFFKIGIANNFNKKNI